MKIIDNFKKGNNKNAQRYNNIIMHNNKYNDKMHNSTLYTKHKS